MTSDTQVLDYLCTGQKTRYCMQKDRLPQAAVQEILSSEEEDEEEMTIWGSHSGKGVDVGVLGCKR
jgi:hypothetical protein